MQIIIIKKLKMIYIAITDFIADSVRVPRSLTITLSRASKINVAKSVIIRTWIRIKIYVPIVRPELTLL